MVALFLPKANTRYFSIEKCEWTPRSENLPIYSWKGHIICYALMSCRPHNTYTDTWRFYLHVHHEDLKVSLRSVSRAGKRCRLLSRFSFSCLPVCAFESVHRHAYLHCNYSRFFILFAILLSTDESTPVIKCHSQRGEARGSLNNYSAAVKLPWL